MSLIHFSCKCNYSILLHNKTPFGSALGLLRVCATCPTPRLNQSYELRPPWEQHLRSVPHRVRNGYNIRLSGRGLCFGLSLVKKIPTECSVSECDREASIMRRQWPSTGWCARKKEGFPIRCSHLGDKGSRASFRNVLLHYNLDDGQSPKKEDWVSESL